jgi:hypothetical protein
MRSSQSSWNGDDMAHIHRHEDSEGDVFAYTFFCSDFCHQSWAAAGEYNYDGWDGCHEAPRGMACGECLAPLD